MPFCLILINHRNSKERIFVFGQTRISILVLYDQTIKDNILKFHYQ